MRDGIVLRYCVRSLFEKSFVHKELDKHRFGRWVHADGMSMVYLFIYCFLRNIMVNNEQQAARDGANLKVGLATMHVVSE